MFVLNILRHYLLGTNRPESWVQCLSPVTNRLGAKDPWVRNDWIPHVRPFANLNGFLLSLCFLLF
mgnify:CR=1 FL=1